MGGAELAMLEVIEGLVARRVECRVVVPTPGELVAELELRSIVCHISSCWWWVGGPQPRGLRGVKYRVRAAASQLHKGWKIAGVLSSWRPDVVVTNTICVPAGAFAAWKLGAAHVWYIHEFGSLDQGLEFLFGRRLSLWVMNRCSDAVICNSHAVAQHFSDGIPATKQRIIMPYRLKLAAGSSEEVPVAQRHDGSLNCIMVGDVVPRKRQEDGVAAVGLLTRAGLDVRLSIVGDQPSVEYLNTLNRLIDEYGIRERVVFVDWVRDPTPYMRAADVLLMCSRMEAFGRVTVEAMRLGRAVIGARSGGTTELICDGETGLLFEVANPTDLAQKMRQLYENRDLMTKLGTTARAWTNEMFTEEATTGKVYEVLCQCAASRGATAPPSSLVLQPGTKRETSGQ